MGTNKLNMKTKPTSMRMKQAAAAVGQCRIMYLYDKFFGDYDKNDCSNTAKRRGYWAGRKEKNLINTFNPESIYEIITGGKTGRLFVGKAEQ